ncbi:MAG: hypothetical protein PHN16_04615, partial [Candidatus Omnitrophica bacterium]|nr:hypothetical protein [Candidatus Omnitrophota bacterium]
VANNVFEVKSGRVRKFPGSFDYYLDKRDSFSDTENAAAKPKQKPAHSQAHEAREKAKQEEQQRKSLDKKRKANNAVIRDKINKIVKKKEELELESYAKARALSNPHFYRDEETAASYGRRLKEIEKLMSELDLEISELEKNIIF